MADSAVVVTAGTGTNIDTRTESTNGNHRQVVVLGDPADNSGIAGVNASLGLKVNLSNDFVSVALVSAASLPLPAGAATSANQTTIIGHLDGVEGLLTTIDADTGIIAANASLISQALIDGTLAVSNAGLTELAAAINSNRVDVNIADSITLSTALISCASLPLPIGAATSANQTTIIGHVDGIETLLGTIDADTGAVKTAVEAIQAAQLPDGHNVTIDNPGDIGGGVQYTEGDTDATITGTAVMVEGAANALAVMTQPLTDTQLRATAVPVSGTVTANLSATDNAVLDAIVVDTGEIQTAVESIDAGLASLATEATVSVVSGNTSDTATNTGDILTSTGATTDAAATAGSEGSIQAKLRLLTSQLDAVKTAIETLDNTVSGSELQVDIVGALPAGTNAIGKLAANSGVDIGDVTLTAGTNAIGTLLPPDIDVTAHTNYARKYYTSATPTDGIIWSPAAGKRWHVVTIYINVSVDSTITLEDDKSGGDDPVWKGEISAKSGAVLHFPEKYPMASGEDAADLTITATAGTVYVTCVGYEV